MDSVLFFKIQFIIIFFIWVGVRYYFSSKINQKVSESIRPCIEKTLVFLNIVGQIIIPMIIMFTPFFDQFKIGINTILKQILVFVSLINILFYAKIFLDLGQSWSPILELKEDHKLVTSGVYKYVRHPMYTHFWLWAISQGIILDNYLVLIPGVLFWAMLYFFRVSKEEDMMTQRFGFEYELYMQTTPRIIPFTKCICK